MNPRLRPRIVRRYRPGQPYRRYREPGARDLLLDSDRVQRLAEQVARVVEAEGPVHTDLLVERLKEINGVARAGANVQANIDRAVATAMRRGRIERVTRDFVKAPGTRLETFRTAGDGVDRPLAQVSPEEIELAVSGELDPAVIRPASDSDTATSYLSVIMPMRI